MCTMRYKLPYTPRGNTARVGNLRPGAVFCYTENMNYDIKFQEGTVKDNGVNGLQVEEALQQCVERLNQYQSEVPCRENAIAITHIETAILWLNKRTEDRKKRGVEGTHEV